MQRDQIHLGFPVVSMPDVAKRGGRLDVWAGSGMSGPEASEYRLGRKLGLAVYQGIANSIFFLLRSLSGFIFNLYLPL